MLLNNLLSEIFFFGNDGFKNMFVYQPIFITLNIKTQMMDTMFLLGNQKEYVILNLHHYTILHL